MHKTMSKLVEKVDVINEKVGNVKEDTDQLKAAAATAAAVATRPHTSQQIPKALSREVKMIHSGLGDEHKYKGNEKFASEHNFAVTKAISQAIMDGDDFDASLIRRACNRYYENVKREFKLLVENKMEEDRRAKALNNRRHRLLNARKAVADQVLTEDDCQFLKDVPACFMSDEETDDDDRQTWRVSQPEWRATRLNEILQKCQQKLIEQQNNSCRMVHRRVASGVASNRQPPRGVKALYLKDK